MKLKTKGRLQGRVNEAEQENYASFVTLKNIEKNFSLFFLEISPEASNRTQKSKGLLENGKQK